MVDLEMATMDQIAEELKKRSCSGVLLICKDAKNNITKESCEYFWWGGSFAAIGLAESFSMDLKHQARRIMR